MTRIAVVGLGKLGSCLAASLAASGHGVMGVDLSEDACLAIAENRPNPEPGLNDMIDQAGQRLNVTDDLAEAVVWSEMAFIVVPTPSTPEGDFDASAVRSVAEAVAKIRDKMDGDYTLVVSSTVSPGTMASLFYLEAPWFHLVYSPLFIALGSVIRDMAEPDFRLIGVSSAVDAAKVANVLGWLDTSPIDPPSKVMSLTEAEITKLAVNAGLALKAAYANTIAMACQNLSGVDARTVLDAVGTDKRIGKAFLRPGAPPGGPCIPRDAKALEHWLTSTGAAAPPHLPRAVQEVVKEQVHEVLRHLAGARNVAILGMAYKTGTPVTEASLGSVVAHLLVSSGAGIFTHDPSEGVTTPAAAITPADAVLVATDHPEYRGLDTQGKPTLDMWGIVKPGPNVTVWGKGQ